MDKIPEMEVTLIRHGETEWNVQRRFQGHLDSPLTETGLRQTKALGERFRDAKLDLVYSSDLMRTRRTAEALVSGNGHEIRFDQRLREKNLGIFEGLNVEEIQTRYPDDFKAFRNGGSQHRIEQGESSLSLLERARKFLKEVLLEHEGKRIAVVTHGGFVRVILKHSLGLSQDTPTRFLIQNTSVHQVVWRKDRWIVTLLGDISHLNGFVPE